MLELIKKAIDSYVKTPIPFAIASLYYGFLQGFLVLAALGVFLCMVFFISLFGLTDIAIFEYIFMVISTLLFLYFSSGAFGAYARSISYVLSGQKPEFLLFFKYSVTKAPLFFGILVVKLSVEITMLVLPAAIFIFVKNVTYIEVLVALLALGAMFLSNFLFFFGFFSAALYETNVKASIKNSFRVLKSAHFMAFAIYLIFLLVAFTLLMPLVQIVALIATFPMIIAALVLFTQEYTKK